jgi:hypothetical protein
MSNVYGQEIGSDPQTVSQALLAGDKGTPRAPTLSAHEAGMVLERQTEGMNAGTKAAFFELLQQKGSESIESVSAGLNQAVGTRFVKSTDSGVPLHPEMQGPSPVHAELKALMAYQGERQRKGSASPAATYHPSQSNYQSRNGTFGALPAPTSYTALRPRTTLRPRLFSLLPKTAPKTGSRLPAGYRNSDPDPVNFTVQPRRSVPVPGADPNLPNDKPPTPGNGNEDSTALVGDDGLAYYDTYGNDLAAEATKSRNIKLALAAAAGIGLILLLRG